ncbi:type II secretion system protein [Massilia sp. ST3]|nr:type II secretion system protein [Massilia sp. ST3]
MLRRARGFTLVEAVLVIVIVGILGAIVAVFIRGPVGGYRDTAARAAVTDEADLALRRVARDLRMALPNSVRVNPNGDAIEFLLTKTGGRYLAAEDFGLSGTPLDFNNTDPATNRDFTVVGGTSVRIDPDDYIVVYNLGEGSAPSDAYLARSGGTDRNIERVESVNMADPNNPVVRLKFNTFATQVTPMTSPGRRFQVVDFPVSYVCERQGDGSDALVRYWDYPINAAQLTPPQGNPRRAVIAARVANCAGMFAYGSAASRRSALVVMNLLLRVPQGGNATVRLVHQVHVDNTP